MSDPQKLAALEPVIHEAWTDPLAQGGPRRTCCRRRGLGGS